MILCSECYDRQGRERFITLIPQSTCADCGRTCLGYEVREIPVAIRRLMEEVALEQGTPQGLHDRQHNRHNRS